MTTNRKNRVQMTVSGTPGTGTITLLAASTGYQTFAAAYAANATVDVLIVDGTAWEVARDCTYTNSGTTLTRGTLERSSTGSVLSLTSAAIVAVNVSAASFARFDYAANAMTPGGILTLETGVPVSATDQTAKTSVYYTPYVHNVINLWDGTNWIPTEFTEKTLALGTLTSGRPYDVFGYLSSGALVLESLAWTSDTARATAVTLQDGRYCKSGDKTRLLLGTFYTTSTTTTEDSLLNRYVANVYNRQLRRLSTGQISDTHTYATVAWREWNNGTNSVRLHFVNAISCAIHYGIFAQLSASTGTSYVSCNIDTTTANGGLFPGATSATSGNIALGASATSPTQASPGRHIVYPLEFGAPGPASYSIYWMTAGVLL